MLFVTVAANTKKAIAMATSHSLKIGMETKETTSKDAGGAWQELEGGILNWSATSDNLRCADEDNPGATYDDLVDLMLERKPIEVVLGEKAETADMVPAAGWTPKAGKCRKGMALITDITSNAPNGGNATFTVSLTGTGALTKLATGG